MRGTRAEPEPGEAADQEPVPAPVDPALTRASNQTGSRNRSLTGLSSRCRSLGNEPAEPPRLDGVADHPQADQDEQAAPGDPRLAREGPDQADRRQVGHRLDQEGRQGQPPADLVPARVAVQEPAEAPRLVHVLDDVVAQADRVARLADPDADHLVLGQQVADAGEARRSPRATRTGISIDLPTTQVTRSSARQRHARRR